MIYVSSCISIGLSSNNDFFFATVSIANKVDVNLKTVALKSLAWMVAYHKLLLLQYLHNVSFSSFVNVLDMSWPICLKNNKTNLSTKVAREICALTH